MSIETRIQKIKDYKITVSAYRKARKELKEAEQTITAKVDEANVDQVHACIKSYYTVLPAMENPDYRDELYPQIAYCGRFNDNPCLVFNCPFYDKKKQYQNQLDLLQQAKKAKRVAFKEIFAKVK